MLTMIFRFAILFSYCTFYPKPGEAMHNLQEIVDHYPIGPVVSFSEVNRRRHATYKVGAMTGCYALQALHPNYANEATLSVHEQILEYLAKVNFPAARLIKTKDGRAFVDVGGSRWRLSTWLDGRVTQEATQHFELYTAASLLSRFHQVMASSPVILEVDARIFDVAHTLKKMREALHSGRRDSVGRYWLSRIELEADKIEKTLPGLLPDDYRGRIIHGDPVFANFVFGPQGDAQGIIGLDSCRQDSILVDLGQAICMWCQDQNHDNGIHLSLPKMETMLMGYAEQKVKFDDIEMVHLPLAPLHYTLELAARYLSDIFEDKHFSWDRKCYLNRRDHNYARLQQLLRLADELQARQQEIDDLIESIFMK